MIGALETHAKSRGPLLGAVALVALVLGVRGASPPERTIEGVAKALGDAAGGAVKADDFLWEERGDFLHDAFIGRRVLFLASATKDGPRDLYRSRVRLTRAGRPITIDAPTNLTRTPLGDERDLSGSGHRVAFTTVTPEGVQGVTLLDLDGVNDAAAEPSAAAHDRANTLGSKLLRALDRLVTTGSTRGLARTEIAFAQPPPEAKLAVGPSALVLSLGSEAIPAAIDFETGALQIDRAPPILPGAPARASAQNPFGAALARVPELARPPAKVIADVVAMSLGQGAASVARAVLEGAPRLPSRREEAAAPPGLRIAADYPAEAGWPPPPLKPPNEKPFDGEGFWHVAPAAQSPAQNVAPPPILEAMVRPDPNDASALVHLVAIDTRRLDLQIVPGAASPAPQGGPHGSGLLPRGPEAKSIVAAFAAGPAPAAKPIGFFGEGRLFSPLAEGAPSIAIAQNGRAAVGPWPKDAIRDAYVAVVQGPDLAQTSPFSLIDGGARIARAALCRTSSGYLVYAFAASAHPASLDAGLALAGCAASAVIAVEPSKIGFSYVRASVDDDGLTTYEGTPASPVMTLATDRLADVALETMAVLVERAEGPDAFATKKLTWSKDAGKQPPPAWLPGVLTLETEELGAKVNVFAFLPGRVTYRLATGTDEGTGSRGDKPGPSPEERGSAVAAFGLSVARRAARRGLVLRGSEIVKPSRGATWLVFDGSRATVLRPGEPVPAGADATEASLTADEHKLLPAAREVGTQRPRSALCSLPDGTVLLAHTSFDTDEATTEVLLDAGCERVVVLDRGAHDGVFAHRAGTDNAPRPAYEATTLFVLPVAFAGTATELR